MKRIEFPTHVEFKGKSPCCKKDMNYVIQKGGKRHLDLCCQCHIVIRIDIMTGVSISPPVA